MAKKARPARAWCVFATRFNGKQKLMLPMMGKPQAEAHGAMLLTRSWKVEVKRCRKAPIHRA